MEKARQPYLLVDLFAGPGGLGEGFAELRGENGNRVFESKVSIERDKFAHQTLVLRHFFRTYKDGEVPDDYYSYLAGQISKTELIEKHKKNWRHAEKTALKISLGKETHGEVKKLVARELNGNQKWALIGGPPCQAYSLVGRSRMSGNPQFEQDERHFLYQEYLKIIIDHRPPVFVMENVKGLLSAKVNGEKVITKIVRDLRSPSRALKVGEKGLEYRLYSLSKEGVVSEGDDPKSFVVRAEEFGVPQARHRMLILGVRSDIDVAPETLNCKLGPTVGQVIGDMPKIRSSISRRKDSADEWKAAIGELVVSKEQNGDATDKVQSLIRKEVVRSIGKIGSINLDTSSKKNTAPRVMREWYCDSRLKAISCHEARSHMVGDLHRYIYAASYAGITGISPKLVDLPIGLLPAHKNVEEGRSGIMFSDRFRVQVKDRASTTVTSHISKDGHYFIHYDPVQCRSLSVREAARLQTFPDNYHFEGPRTAQYHQVGNAVPPFLAVQIAEIVRGVLDKVSEY